MLRLHKEKDSIPDIFGITGKDLDFLMTVARIFYKDDVLVISRILQRLWIDENISDNVKCFGIFELGRWYGHVEEMEKRKGKQDE